MLLIVNHLLLMECRYCNHTCIKKGHYNQVQKFYCKFCCKYQRSIYTYKITQTKDDVNIVLLIKESMSISSIARYLQMAKTTVSRRILKLGQNISAPVVKESNQIYEADEMQTFIGRRHRSCHVYIIPLAQVFRFSGSLDAG